MAQDVQIIDLRRSYIPIDPNAFPITELATTGEDNPEPRIPVIPYDGYNFMPTPQGYSSYFGTNVKLGINTLIASGGTGNVDDIFMIQTLTLDNILVALCDDGIWTKSATASGNWTHVIVLIVPAVGIHSQWSKCVLENEVFCYRQGESGHYKATPSNSYIFTIEIPTFLNMVGQLGIFKAGGRLGYWDSENSISWSALGNTQDFIPDLESMAGNTIFQDIVGKIIICLQHGTGFVIYATKSIVQVARNIGSPMLWQGKSLFNNNGISFREEVVVAEPDTTHFAFTTQGLAQIAGTANIAGSLNTQGEFIIAEVATFLKEKRQPVFLKMMNGRYLFFTLLDPYYITGNIQFSVQNIPGNSLEFGGAVVAIDGFTTGNGNAGKAMAAVEASFDTYFIKKQLGKDSKATANTVGSVPIWEDHLSFIIPKADLAVFKTFVDSNNIGGYFTSTGFTGGVIAKVTGGNDTFIPTKSPQLISVFLPVLHVEDNAHDFWNSQDMIWFYQRLFMQGWIDAIKNKAHTINTTTLFGSAVAGTVLTNHIYGPYTDLSYFSESNKYYGSAIKSAWLQRSLTKGISIGVVETVITEVTPGFNGDAAATWTKTSGSGGSFGSYNACIADAAASFAAGIATYNASHSFSEYVDANNVTLTLTSTTINYVPSFFIHNINPPGATSGPFVGSGNQYTASGGAPAGGFTPSFVKTQFFSVPQLIYNDYPPCTYKELGFTKIKGHGHYTALGVFVVDNATADTTDFVDQCLTTQPKKRTPVFQGITIGSGGFPGFGQPTTINGTTYIFPPFSVSFPSGSILLQIGSIEPIYPTFLGAFIFDTQYKRWGKMAQNYKRLLDYFPINDVAGEQIVPYDSFLPRGAILEEDGLIYLFDQFPSDSYITYGKVGLYRKGFTQSEEIRIVNRNPMNGSITLEGSLTSGDINPSLSISRTYAAAKEFTAYAGASARWYNIKVEGNYDLIALEFRGHRTGKR